MSAILWSSMIIPFMLRMPLWKFECVVASPSVKVRAASSSCALLAREMEVSTLCATTMSS